jgi:hypothetical protein
MTISMTTATRNARGDAITTATGNAALLRIYDGTPPASANAALSGNVKLAELTAGSPFAPAASGAVLTANSITQDASADATGTASFFRLYKADGTTVIMQGTVGTSGADLNLNTTSIVAAGPVAVTSFALTEGNP